ncbi:MAG TPA: sulfonate ABC transporter substrate-binding protein [Microbacteriaceae bacterium]|nr:sulfonate ABC transporter substrate-binding protein [Microbacteriaceae bacterium]
MNRRKLLVAIIVGLVAATVMSGCAASSNAAEVPTGTATPAAELRLGYFANVTHAPALVGLDKGFFAKALGATKLSTQLFSAGPATIEALSAGAIDAAYIGPSPAINSYIKSGGESAVIVAGATTGGAALVVRNGIDSPADLKGTTLATPQLGNTQDVALRSWLAGKGYSTSITGGGDVTIAPTENADTLTLFKSGKLDGAWLPEPWVSRLVIDGGAHVLVDEASLWKNGAFPTTVLLVNKSFLKEHPQTVKALLRGHVDAVNWLNKNPAEAAAVINKRIAADTGKSLEDAVIERALKSVRFSVDPQAATYPTLLKHAVSTGTVKDGNIDGLFDLTLVNQILSAAGADTVSAHKLGKE